MLMCDQDNVDCGDYCQCGENVLELVVGGLQGGCVYGFVQFVIIVIMYVCLVGYWGNLYCYFLINW